MILEPMVRRKDSCARHSSSTSSIGLVKMKLENHWLQISIPRRSSAFFKTSGSFGYLLPTSDPVNPARAISLTHCSKVFSLPRSGMSSLVQAIGAIPSLTFVLSNILTSYWISLIFTGRCSSRDFFAARPISTGFSPSSTPSGVGVSLTMESINIETSLP